MSDCIYVNTSGRDQIPCGSISNPCRSLSFTINNISCYNDTICLIASPIKQIRYPLKNTIVIKYSLSVSKFPAYGQNPLITYDPNVTSNQKKFYAFAIFRDALAPNILTLNIKSVNFHTNILTTFSESLKALQKNVIVGEISGFQLWLSISDSIVTSTSHAVNFSDISTYENLAINMKDLVIKSGDFMFENKRERCEHSEHITDIIEMYNVTICNTGNVTLSVHGCFNISIEKLTCNNITWNQKVLFRFTGSVLNAKNVLIKNILTKDNMTYNKPETKALFLINESVAEIQNVLIKDCVGMSTINLKPKRFSAVIIVQNSKVQILNMKIVGNSFQNFAQARKSYLCFKNITLIENNVTATFCRLKESNVILHEIRFHRNKIGCLVFIKQKSKVLITNNSLPGNEIFKAAYSISRSLMKLYNTNFCGNKIKRLMLAKSQSQIYIDNVAFTNNHVSSDFLNISRESKVEMYNAGFLQNNLPNFLCLYSSDSIVQNSTLTENKFSSAAYIIWGSSTIQLNHVAFTRNKLARWFFHIMSNSSAIIQNNTLLENNFSWRAVYGIFESSTIQVNHVAFTRNKLAMTLFYIWSTSSAIIQNNTLLENNFSWGAVYAIFESSTIQLNHVVFTRNKLKGLLLFICLNSIAIIQNNTLLENNASRLAVYTIVKSSTIQLNHVAFIRNKLESLEVFSISWNSSAIIQNNALLENDISGRVYDIRESSTIQLNHVVFIRNKLKSWELFYISSNSSAIIQNNTLLENDISGRVYDIRESSTIQLNHVVFIRNKLKSWELFYISSNSSAIIQNNTLLENDISWRVYDIRESSTIQLNHVVFTRNKLKRSLLFISSNSSAIIQNNTLLENDISGRVYDIRESSTIQLNHVVFIRNKLKSWELFYISSNSSAIIQNNTLLENDISGRVYDIRESSTIQLNHVVFIRNKLKSWELFYISSNSSAIIQNNTLLENDISWRVYDIRESSTIQLNHVVFTRNKLKRSLLFISSNSSAIIQNNTLLENNFSQAVYEIRKISTIQLINVAFIQNTLLSNLLYMLSSSCAKLVNNRITGNSLDQIFFAHSSYLEINTTFVKNNKFSQLIKVFECNVSFESMKIRENNVIKDMIYVENGAGKMTHTYIENSGNSLSTAITTTWTYLENIYIPFEIISTEIIWTNEAPVSAKPIIQLSGNVSLSNVKLLVTSIFETEILKYSTKHMTMFVNEDLKNFPNIYTISSLFIGCTKARVKHITGAGIFRCIPCARGTYTLNNESLNTSLSFQHITKPEKTNFTCLNCPVGANCTASIKSKSNFYGYKTKEQELKFLPCPRGFCCTANQCNKINSCNKNRTGTLCGRCIKSYMESFLSTDCISIHSCQNFTSFWLLYCIYALILATFLYYMKDFISLIKTTARNSKKILKSCKKEKESDSESEINIMISTVGAEEQQEKTSHFTVSGIFTLIVSFYQIKQLMKVDVQYKNSTDFSLITFITDCFNLEMVAVTYSSYCPMSNLDAVSKTFIKTYLLSATLLIACLINYFMSAIFHFFRSSLGRLSSLKPSDRLGVCFIRLLMLSYKNMASASLLLLKCVKVADKQVLFIKGDIECYQWWQVVTAVLFFTWILFFPLSLKISFNMFMKDKISFTKFILCLIVPFAVVANYRLNRSIVSVDLQKSRNTYKVKEILSEIFQESYRLKTDNPSGETVFYETWRLYQRVLLAIAATFWIDPLERITIMTPIVILIAVSYHVIKPYKREMYVLHWMEIFSILGIFVSLVHNMFRGFLYVYDIGDEDPVKFVWQRFAVFDLVFSPVLVLIYFFIIAPIYNRVKHKVTSFCITIPSGDLPA